MTRAEYTLHHRLKHPMTTQNPLAPMDSPTFSTPDREGGQSTPSKSPPQTGFPPEVPRHPPHENPEWIPRNPDEAPLHNPSPSPDWSPSGSAVSTVEEGLDIVRSGISSPPYGTPEAEDKPDERGGPPVVEDPSPHGEPADEGGDIEEPGSQNPTPLATSHRKPTGCSTTADGPSRILCEMNHLPSFKTHCHAPG
jgi:hypothetical protein